MRLLALLSISALLLVSVGVAQEGEPEVMPEEVVAPPTDWTEDWGGNPPPWFEDAEDIDCDAAPSWCQSEAVQASMQADGGVDA